MNILKEVFLKADFMDKLDEGILKFLKEDALTPISEIASKLKVPKPTVYVRLNKLKKDGIIKKFTIVLSSPSEKINTAVLECKDFLISKMTSKTSEKVISHLKQSTQVEFIIRLSPSQLLVGWKGEMHLPQMEGVEKVSVADTVFWKN